MNTGLSTSFVIGGLIIISIFTLNNRMLKNSQETTLDMMTRTYMTTTSQIIGFDLRKTGYEVAGTAFGTVNDHDITIYGDIDGDGKVDTVTYNYEYNKDLTTSKNPNDHPLYRTFNGKRNLVGIGVTSFTIQYVMKNGSITSNPTNPANIRKIHVSMVCQSPEGYGKNYQKVSWQKLFVPANLQL